VPEFEQLIAEGKMIEYAKVSNLCSISEMIHFPSSFQLFTPTSASSQSICFDLISPFLEH
jgi:hypothetical protein